MNSSDSEKEPLSAKIASPSIASIALNLPLHDSLDYLIPKELTHRIQIGTRVEVPLGRRRLVGICIGLKGESEIKKLREILRVLDEDPVLTPSLLALARFVATYYCCSLGEALGACLPAPVRNAKRGTPSKGEAILTLTRPRKEIEAYLNDLSPRLARQAETLRFLLQSEGPVPQREVIKRTFLTNRSPIETLIKNGLVSREHLAPETGLAFPGTGTSTSSPGEENPKSDGVPPIKGPILSAEQSLALEHVVQRVRAGTYRTILVLGVTGSGKTELYLRSIREVLDRGKKAIVLLPEIALTPQTVSRFAERFEHIAVLHSNLSDRERLLQWRAIRKGKADVVIGARSAVFAPVDPLGMIIVDEEHEPSYKQQSSPRYQARDLAIVRAEQSEAIVLLGSATPSLESFENARRGKYDLVMLRERIGGRPLPPVEIVDIGKEHAEQKRFALLSRRLHSLMTKTLDRGEQVLLFLNRRGFSTIVRCKRCGRVESCEMCEITLTYHQSMNRLRCHYCGLETLPPPACPDCEMPGMSYLGLGTEKIEDEIGRLFPNVPTARMDSDSMQGIGVYERTLDAFRKEEIQILIGTQMIAKGHDFPKVTLVGILMADSGLHLPDFRAAERTFQLVAQAAGRSGRGSQPGRVILQAYSVDHYSLLCGSSQDYGKFAETEIEHREVAGYPPFGKLGRIVVRSKSKEAAEAKAQAIRQLLSNRTGGEHGLSLLGPAPLFRLRGEFRFHLLVKAKEARPVLGALRTVLEAVPSDHRGHVALDMDPVG